MSEQPTQPSLFDVVEAAIATADRNANPDWKDAAARCIAFFAGQCREFTSDDVIERLEEHYPDAATHNMAALGPLFLRASRAGLIENTGRMIQSRIPRRHRKITVWRPRSN